MEQGGNGEGLFLSTSLLLSVRIASELSWFLQKCSCRWKDCEFLPECCEKQKAPVFLIRFREGPIYPTPHARSKQLMNVPSLDLFLLLSG